MTVFSVIVEVLRVNELPIKACRERKASAGTGPEQRICLRK